MGCLQGVREGVATRRREQASPEKPGAAKPQAGRTHMYNICPNNSRVKPAAKNISGRADQKGLGGAHKSLKSCFTTRLPRVGKASST